MKTQKRKTPKQKFNLLEKWAKRGGSRFDAEWLGEKYQVSADSLYRWKKQFNRGGIEFLTNQSTRPHSHPNQHTAEELSIMREVRNQNPHKNYIQLYSILRLDYAYNRSFDGFCHCMRMNFIGVKPPRPKYIRHRQPELTQLGIESQMDVKYVPTECFSPQLQRKHKFTNERWYLYNVIDITSREIFSYTYCSIGQAETLDFTIRYHMYFGYKFHYGRTDRGREFTNDDTERKSPLQNFYETIGTEYIKNPPASPWRNAYIERNNRTWQEEFFAANINSFTSFEDCQEKVKLFLIEYNTRRGHSALKSATGQRHITPEQKRNELLAQSSENVRFVKQNRNLALKSYSRLFTYDKLPA